MKDSYNGKNIDDIIAQKVAAEVAALKKTNLSLKEEKQKLATQLQDFKKQQKGLGDESPDAKKKLSEIKERYTNIGFDKAKMQISKKEDELNQIQKSLANKTSELASYKIHNKVAQAALNAGVRADALELASNEMQKYFVLNEGDNITIDKELTSKSKLLKERDISSPEEFANTVLREKYPFFFHASSGVGASGASENIAINASNPFAQKSKDLAEQGRLINHEPAKARRLIMEAGLQPSIFNL